MRSFLALAVIGLALANPMPPPQADTELEAYTELAPEPYRQARSELACGDHTLAKGTYTIKSPNHPGSYDNNFDCSYNLALGSGVTSLSLSCSAFNIERHSSCAWDYLKIGNTKYCGTTAPSVNSNGAMAISFHSDGSAVRAGYLCTIEARAGTGTPSPPCTDCCGQVNRATRVVGGVETEVNEYPWQAGLVSPGGTRTFCGGSLINDRYVVTAAHCTAGRTAPQFEVLLGDHRISVADGETRHTVAEIKDHPRYTGYQNGFDISLLRLATPVTYNTKIAPACLPTAGQTYAGAQAITTGWGRVGAGQPQATELLEVQLEVRTEAYCSTKWGFVKSSMICAGGTSSGGTSICNGDSGGPLVTLENNRYTLIGVVSFGRPCAFPKYPDVFCRVTEALAWIQSNTADATY